VTALASLPFGSKPSDIIAHVESDGGVIVSDFFDTGELTTINADMDDAIQRRQPGARTGGGHRKKFHGVHTKRLTRLFGISPTFRRVLDDALIKAVADHFLLEPSGPYWLNSAQAIVRGPGEANQALHRDNGNWPLFANLQKQLPEATVSFMFAMTEFNAQTGATRVVPRSHLPENYDREAHMADAVPVDMAAGSVLIYLGSTLHGGGANETPDQWRRGIFLAFCLGWLVPSEVSVLEYPLEMVRSFSPRARQLLGFKGYEPGRRRGGRLWNIDYEDLGVVLGFDEADSE
jgi:ectoine hydroxylase-related dioxygenase (phytanoyl-CoA dioxygenase family)